MTAKHVYIYIYKTCIIYVYTFKHQPVHTYQYSKFRKILFYQESTAGCGASAVRVGVATFCRREPVTCGEITPHLATFESRTSYKWPTKSPTPCLSKNLRAQSQKTLVSQSWCTIHTPKCLKYAKINKNCFCLPGATYASFVSPCTFTWCSCALTSFKEYAFKECQKCLLLKKLPRHAPHAALANDPLKPFFREQEVPSFWSGNEQVDAFGRFEKRDTSLWKSTSMPWTLDHQTCSAPGIAMTPTLCKIKFQWKQQQNSMISDGQWISVISVISDISTVVWGSYMLLIRVAPWTAIAWSTFAMARLPSTFFFPAALIEPIFPGVNVPTTARSPLTWIFNHQPGWHEMWWFWWRFCIWLYQSLAFQKWHWQSRIKAESVSDQRLIFEVTGPQREILMTCAGGSGTFDRKKLLGSSWIHPAYFDQWHLQRPRRSILNSKAAKRRHIDELVDGA